MVRNTRNALSALIALNMRSSLKMAATSKEPTFCTISGSRKSTTVKRTMSRSRKEYKNYDREMIKGKRAIVAIINQGHCFRKFHLLEVQPFTP